MGKRTCLRQIESLRKRIAEHYKKIEAEKRKPIPNEGLIIYWEKEIERFKTEVLKSEKRLKRG